MRVFNLTDVTTPALEGRGLANQHMAVAGRMVAPGEFVDVEDSPTSRSNLEYLIKVGAVAIDKLPPPYVQARQLASAGSGQMTPRLAQHVNVQETKVAAEPATAQSAEGEQVTLEKADSSTEESDPPLELEPSRSPPLPGAAPQKKKNR